MQLSVLASLWSTLGHSTTWKPSYKTTKTWNLAHKFGFAVKKSICLICYGKQTVQSFIQIAFTTLQILHPASSPSPALHLGKALPAFVLGLLRLLFIFFFKTLNYYFFAHRKIICLCWALADFRLRNSFPNRFYRAPLTIELLRNLWSVV